MVRVIVAIVAALIVLYAFHKAMMAWTVKRTRDWADEKDKDRDYRVWQWREIQSKRKRRRR